MKEWRIEKVFSITADNAKSNDKMIAHLKNKFNAKGKVVDHEMYVHVICIAHIFNIVVQEALKDVKNSVKKVRNAVKFIRSSPARLKKFKECADSEGIECSKSLCLDVPTRWNSTYLMLSTAEKYEKAFEFYETVELYFKLDLESDSQERVPSFFDWDLIRKMSNMLKQFYLATLRVSYMP